MAVREPCLRHARYHLLASGAHAVLVTRLHFNEACFRGLEGQGEGIERGGVAVVVVHAVEDFVNLLIERHAAAEYHGDKDLHEVHIILHCAISGPVREQRVHLLRLHRSADVGSSCRSPSRGPESEQAQGKT